LRTRAIPERLRGVFTTGSYTNTRLPLPLPMQPLNFFVSSAPLYFVCILASKAPSKSAPIVMHVLNAWYFARVVRCKMAYHVCMLQCGVVPLLLTVSYVLQDALCICLSSNCCPQWMCWPRPVGSVGSRHEPTLHLPPVHVPPLVASTSL